MFGAMPFFISGAIPNYADAFFETVSGFTTTGASILTDVEIIPRGLSFWRSFYSVYIDIVIGIFMILAGANFNLYYDVFKGRWRVVLNCLPSYCYFPQAIGILIDNAAPIIFLSLLSQYLMIILFFFGQFKIDLSIFQIHTKNFNFNFVTDTISFFGAISDESILFCLKAIIIVHNRISPNHTFYCI